MMNMNKFKNPTKIKDLSYGELYKIDYDTEKGVVPACLKCINVNAESKDELINSIEFINKINGNKNVIEYYDYYYDNQDQCIYIISEYLDDLESKYSKRLCDESTCVEIAKNVLVALTEFHVNGIFHNNINIDNIFVSDSVYKLGDFDFINNNATASTDIYQLGLVMYRILSGMLPFGVNSYEEVLERQKAGDKIGYLENVSASLMNIIIRMLEIDETLRYKDVGEVFSDLKNVVLDTETINASSSSDRKVKASDTFDIENVVSLKKVSHDLVLINRHKGIGELIKKILFVLFFLMLMFSAYMLYNSTKLCKKGYINRFGFCIKGNYSCPNGYKLDGNRCLKKIKEITAHESYICPEDYIYQNDFCVYKKFKEPERTYKCADDFTLKGKKCIQEISADAVTLYSCPNNYVLAGTSCVTLNSFDATKNYYCPDESYTRNGSLCTTEKDSYSNPIVTYGCTRGGSFINGSCVLTSYPIYDSSDNHPICPKGSTYDYNEQRCHTYYSPTPSYSCLVGTLTDDNRCVRKTSSTAVASTKYTCPEGYILVGNKCTNSATINATPKYVCTDEMELKDRKCYGKVSTDAIALYTCPDGYVLSGLVCVKDDFKEPEIKYSCSRIYTLKGKKCEKYNVLRAKVHYN